MACPENLTFSIVQILWRWWAGILYHYKVRWWFSCSKLAIGLKSVTSFRNVLTSCLSGWSLVAIIWLWADDCWMVIVSWWLLNGGSRLSCPETVTVRLQTSDPHWMCYLLPCRSISQRMREGMAIYNAPVYKNFSAKIYIMHVPSAGIWKKIKFKKACIFAHTL